MDNPRRHLASAWSKALKWAFLSLLLVGLSLPRFNLRDSGPVSQFTTGARATQYGLPLDVAGYVRLVQYFRGAAPADSLIPPFCYRPLVPFVASKLPFEPLTSINVVNIIALLLSVLVLDRLLRLIGYGHAARTVGDLLFIVSFPTFYYGAIGFVDPVAVLMICVGILFTLRGSWILLLPWVVLATLVKETNALIALLPGVLALARRSLTPRTIAWVTTLGAAAVATVLLVRALSNFPAPGWVLVPSLKTAYDNLARPRAILSLLLTLGLPGVLSIIAVLRRTAQARLVPSHYRFFLHGAGLVVLLYAYTLVGAYADGRVVWIIYPFLIPLALTVCWSPRVEPSCPNG